MVKGVLTSIAEMGFDNTSGWVSIKKGVEKNMVEPVTIAAGIANISAALPLVQDALIYGANWLVTNTIGAVMLGMVTVSFGVALAVRIVKGRRGRR